MAAKGQKAKKTFVLDTSVLLADPGALYRFAEHEVIIPIAVIGELETKRDHPELGYFARAALRALDVLRVSHGRLDKALTITPEGGTLSVELNHNDWLVHSVLATWHDLLNLTVDLGRDHNSVFSEEVVLEDKTENITSAHVVSGLEFIAGGPVPSLVLIKAGYVHTTGHKNAFRQVSNGLKGALNTIENRVQDT